MKKVLLFFLTVVLTTCLFAQSTTVFLNETFDQAGWPEGWERKPWSSGGGTPDANAISVSNNNYAGGTPWEVEFIYLGPNTSNRYGKLLSPVLPANVPIEVTLEFLYSTRVMWQPSSIDPTIVGVGTTCDDGETFNTIWEYTVNQWEDVDKVLVSELVQSPDFRKENCRLLFYYLCASTETMTRRWYFDNVKLYIIINDDASLTSIDGVPEVTTQGLQGAGFTFKNYGLNTITSVEASYQFEGMPKVTEVFSNLSVAPSESLSLTFAEKTKLAIGDYDLTLTIDKVNGTNDDEPTGNTLSAHTKVYMTFGEQRVVINHFTSATCAPCVNPNKQMQDLLKNHPETVISKYQMNYPVQGDPYFFPDGDIRKEYYGVTGVPTIYTNGSTMIRDDFEKRFNEAFAKQVPVVEVRGNWNIDANAILNVDFNVAAYDDIEDAVVHVTINKQRTTGNAVPSESGGNGETAFFHVMMKMLPDGNGTAANFSKYETRHFTFDYDMNLVLEKLAEEDQNLDSLEVNVFVQQKTSKQIYNGNWLLERDELINEPPSNLELEQAGMKSYPTLVKWNAPSNDKFTGYNVYINDEKVASNIPDNFYTCEISMHNTELSVVKVSAVYPDDTESVRIAESEITWTGDVKQYDESHVKLYPNPTDNAFTVSADKMMQCVEIYNMIGQVQSRTELNTDNYTVNVAHYPAGIYFVKIMFADGSMTSKKVVVD